MSSGLHSDVYFEKFRVLEDPKLTEELLARVLPDARALSPEWVVGPTTGGALVAWALARSLGCLAGVAERGDRGRVIRRGFDLSGRRVLVADDVLTTGGSVRETVRAVREAGGLVVGVAVMVLRSPDFRLDLPLLHALVLPARAWKPEECPLCREGVPLAAPGRGKG